MKQNKYNAKKVTVNNTQFDSMKEARYYISLLACRNAVNPSERVERIAMQKRYDMIVNGKNCGFYKLDFEVEYSDGTIKCVDVKGCRKGAGYQLFRLKKKIIEALYNIEIVEV